MKKSAYTWGLALLLATGVARADLFGESIPADAKVVLIVNDLAKLEAGAKAFAESSGLPMPPVAGLNMLAGQLGLGEAWDVKQGVALALTELDQTGIAVLIPVTDPKVALDKLGAEPEGEHHRVRIAGMPVLALAKENLLIVAENAETLDKFRSPAEIIANGWSGAEEKLLGESNVFFHINVESLRPLIETSLRQAEVFIGELEDTPPAAADPETNPDVAEKVLGLYLKAAREVAAQMSVVYGGVSVDADRVRFEKGVVFSAGSYARTMLARRKPPTANLLDHLPQFPFYAAMGVDTAGLRPMVMDLFGKMYDEALTTAEVDAAERKGMVDKAMAMYAQMNGFNGIVDIGDDGMTAVGVYFFDDPKLAQRQITDSMLASEAMMKTFMPVAMDIKHEKRKIDDIEVDEFVYEFTDPEDESNAEQLKMIKAIYGDKLRMQFGVVGKSLGFAMSNRKDAIGILSSDGKALAAEPRIRAILDDLPDGPFAIVLIDPFGFVRMMAKTAGEIGMPTPFPEVPKDVRVTPIGIAVTADAEGFVGHVIVRSDTVAEIVKFVNTFRRR